jgi:hypothetical protein
MSEVSKEFFGTASRGQEGQRRSDRGQSRTGCRIEPFQGPQGRESARFAGGERVSDQQTQVVSGYRH